MISQGCVTGCVFHGDDCWGRLTVHHIVSQQRIKRAHKTQQDALRHDDWVPLLFGLTDALNDERNLVVLCWFHHGQVEAKRLYVTVPDSAREFAAEYGLLAELESDERRAA